MSVIQSGPGIGLALPQYLYPTELQNAPYDLGSSQLTLNAGDAIPIPSGTWYISLGSYCVLQWLDPYTSTWRIAATATQIAGLHYVKSDGFNLRIANMTGCPVGGVVTAPGNGSYVQASTSIAVTGGGGSTWSPIVGGQLGSTTVTSAGAGYGVTPLVFIPGPPPAGSNINGVGGVPASGYATISSGTVSGFTFTNPGAGYRVAPTITVLPNPTDPNLSTGITAATITCQIVGAGSLTGVLCTNPGAPLSTPDNITLTVSGAGANGTVVAVMMQTVTNASVTGGSTIAAATLGANVTSSGGGYPTSTFTNSPEQLGLAGRPRQPNITLSIGGAGTLTAVANGTILDGGLFFKAPNPILNILSTAASTGTIIGSSTLAFTMGSRADIVILQPAP